MSPVSEALQRDAKAYAEAHDVPLDEAIRRLRQQDPVGELSAVLQEQEADVFGGLWIQHEPEYEVIVLVTGDAADQERIRRRYVQGGPLEDTVEIREAGVTRKELKAAQVELMQILEAVGSRAQTGIDVRGNCVALYTTDPEAFLKEVEATGLTLPEPVCIVDTGPYPEAPPLAPPPGIVFPRQHPPEGLRQEMTALLIGTLVEEDGCLRVEEGESSHLIIWPYDHTVIAAEDGTLQIRDGSGVVVARVGDVVRMGGGETRSLDSVTPMEIPARCTGPYWIAGSQIDSSAIMPSLQSLTVFTAAGLTIEEHAIVSATVAVPNRFEFLDRIPEDVLARRAAWRGFDTERRLSRLNEALAPFDCRLTAEENAGWQGIFYDFYCEDREILSNLRHVWSVSVNDSGTDFAFVAENAPNKSTTYLLVQKDAVHPLLFPDQWNYVAPVYRGDQLLTVERLDDGQFAVTQGDEVLYTYRDRGIRSDRPIKRLLVDEGDWILEARGEVLVNGESLNQRLDVDEIFHYVILQGQPLFLFERGGEVGVSYGGETLPVVYDEVIHYQCCEPAMFNVASNEHMLWFYALRDGIWHYVEMGVFE
jgi:hypothetical protein